MIKLRNPHGNEGAEWTGYWSDYSPKWTTRYIELIKDKFDADGAFWMSIEDFTFEYRALYLCRTFDPKIWLSLP